MQKEIIVIIGGGVLQLPLIKESIKQGYLTVVVDGDSNADGGKLADQFIHSDIADAECCLKAVKNYLSNQNKKPSGVLTIGTDFTYSVALINHYYGLKAISLSSAEKTTDKVLMRQALKKAGVNQPNFTSFEIKDDLSKDNCSNIKSPDLSKLTWPLVVKPVDNMGARGCLQMKLPKEVNESIRFSLSYSKKKKVIIEEFIDGKEFSIDAIINNGEIYIHGVADRMISDPPYFVELGHIMPSQAEVGVRDKIVSEFKKAIKSLDIHHGYAKGDLFFSQGKAYVGEVATRLSGGFMSGFTYPYSTGVNLTSLALEIATDSFKRNPEPKWEKCSIERGILVDKSGVIKDIEGIDKIRKKKSVRNVFIKYVVGKHISFPKSNVEKGGNIIVEGNTYKEADDLSRWALEEIKIIFK